MSKLFSAYKRAVGIPEHFGRTGDFAQFTGQAASDKIKEGIVSGNPLMVARFGANEINVILNYLFINQSFGGNVKNLFRGIPYFLQYKKSILKPFNVGAGFFPTTKECVDRFAAMSLEDTKYIDILGSWLKQEKFLLDKLPASSLRVQLRDLSPLRHDHPWTSALAGKKVLVVHPFDTSIREQYAKRKKLFNNPEVLPDFDLITLRSVSSLASQETPFDTWFDALDHMKNQIAKIGFDIAILGCGAYGMPLAAHIKRSGKQAIHLGGETQIIFGIKGARWEIPSYNYQEKYYNEYWIRPHDTEKPKNAHSVEGACYW